MPWFATLDSRRRLGPAVSPHAASASSMSVSKFVVSTHAYGVSTIERWASVGLALRKELTEQQREAPVRAVRGTGPPRRETLRFGESAQLLCGAPDLLPLDLGSALHPSYSAAP